LKIGYFDCFAGASGDMILASLFDAGLESRALAEGLGALGLGGIEIRVGEVMKKGVRAKTFGFACESGPRFGTFKDIVGAIERSALGPAVKSRSVRTFEILAEAEARIHGIGKQDVHFHEVGSLDSVVDIVGSMIGLEALGLERISSSPLALGTGHIECEHGVLPSPAPATLEVARGLPVRGWAVAGELTTPTGAAILRTAASDFGPVPAMTVTAIGYGAGARDLEAIPNVMRIIVGETGSAASALYERDRVTHIETNIDDMNPQVFSHVFEKLFGLGVLDVWVESIMMKKGRPGFLLGVLALTPTVPAAVDLILSETSSSGVRLAETDRVKLGRREIEIATRFGKVKVKVFRTARGERGAPEYEDCLRIAVARGVPVADVMEEARRAFNEAAAGGA
jgi:pyridinium-3,5-bisthiocarboxylic acid mononucleotide nickel chelatase